MSKSSKSAASAPIDAGSATVTASATPTGQTPGRTDGPAPDTMVLDWDPQELGAEAGFEGEHGMGNDPSSPTPRGKKLGDADVTDPDNVVFDASGNAEETRTADAGPEAPAEPAEGKEARAERRKTVMEAWRAEKARIASEQAQATSREEAAKLAKRAEDAEAKLAGVAKGSLSDKLAFLGLTGQQLTDAIIMNGGDLEAAAKENGAGSAEMAELRAELATVKKALTDQASALEGAKAAEVARQTEQARAGVTALLVKEQVPLVKGLKAHDRVLAGAWQAWQASGKKGGIGDFVPAAAEVIEEQLREEFPDLAAAIKGQAAESGAAAGAPKRRIPVPAVGTRTGPGRTSRAVDPLSRITDPDEKTRAVIREMGWDRPARTA